MRLPVRHLSAAAVALLPIGRLEVTEDSYENGFSILGAFGWNEN